MTRVLRAYRLDPRTAEVLGRLRPAHGVIDRLVLERYAPPNDPPSDLDAAAVAEAERALREVPPSRARDRYSAALAATRPAPAGCPSEWWDARLRWELLRIIDEEKSVTR